MALVPFTITAIERDLADAVASGKQVVVGAVCSLFLQPSDVVAQLYDNAAGDNGATAKTTNSSGQVTVWVEAGDYRVSVNSNDSFISLQTGGETVTASVTETQTLAAAQTTVTLVELTTTGTAFYINGPSVDNGRLVLGVDFTLTSTATIELTTAYADGTLITAVQNDGTEALFTAVKVFDNIAEMKADTSLVVDDYVICKRYYSGGELVDGLNFNVVSTATVDGFIDHANDNGTFSVLANNGNVTVRQGGAIGGGATDNSSILNSIFQYGKDKNVKITSDKDETYRCLTTVVINCNADLRGCTFTSPFSLAAPVIRTSAELAGVNLIEFLDIKYPSVFSDRFLINGLGTPFQSGSVGIRVDAVINANMVFDSVYGFENGIVLYSGDVSSYISYCNFTYGKMSANLTNVLFLAESSGWVNECNHYGGQWALFSADSSAFDLINLKMVKTVVGGNNPANGHTFYGISMEGNFQGGTIVQDFAGVDTFVCANSWVGCRFEGGIKFEFSPIGLAQTFIGCWGEQYLEFVGDIKPNGIGFRYFNFRNEAAPAAGASNRRTSVNNPSFDVANTGTAMAVTASFSGLMNAGVTGAGLFESYSPTNDALLFPFIQSGVVGGLPTIGFGGGTASPSDWFKWFGAGDLRHNTDIKPSATNTYDLGSSSLRYLDVYAQNIRTGSSGAIITSGTGSPEGSVAAPVGSIYTDTAGGAGTTLYVKETGASFTGWVSK